MGKLSYEHSQLEYHFNRTRNTKSIISIELAILVLSAIALLEKTNNNFFGEI